MHKCIVHKTKGQTKTWLRQLLRPWLICSNSTCLCLPLLLNPGTVTFVHLVHVITAETVRLHNVNHRMDVNHLMDVNHPMDVNHLMDVNNLSHLLALTGWSSTSQPLSRHILIIDSLNFCSLFSRIYFNPYLHCWVAIPGYMACPLLGSSYPA